METIRVAERAEAAYDRRMYAIRRTTPWTATTELKMRF